jgi:lysozyme
MSITNHTSRLEQLLIRHEGFRNLPYDDKTGQPIRLPSGGAITIGVGRNLSERGISREIVLQMLREDIAISTSDLIKSIGLAAYSPLNDARRAAFISMCFNLGVTRFSKFTKLIAAIQAQDWARVELEMRESTWFKQVGQRGFDLAYMASTGTWLPSEEEDER